MPITWFSPLLPLGNRGWPPHFLRFRILRHIFDLPRPFTDILVATSLIAKEVTLQHNHSPDRDGGCLDLIYAGPEKFSLAKVAMYKRDKLLVFFFPWVRGLGGSSYFRATIVEEMALLGLSPEGGCP